MSATAERLRGQLQARGAAWAGPIEHFSTLGSTNDLLKERARAGAPEWSVVLADEQTAGRGRQGHAWASPPGGLYLSVLMRPRFRPGGLIPLAAGVAVADALAEQGLSAQLKWPNDVLIGEHKLGGILAESAAGDAGLEWVVVGVGINLEVPPAGLPVSVRATATSFREETGAGCDAVALGAAVLAGLAVWYDDLIRGEPAALLAAWRARSVPWWGRPVEARSAAGIAIRGLARDVDEGGALLLELEDGSRVPVIAGDVRELRLRDPGSR
jgi:BirA family biotin operon repressor/biotin-[acetyl-CoA-carboxylase] ligase